MNLDLDMLNHCISAKNHIHIVVCVFEGLDLDVIVSVVSLLGFCETVLDSTGISDNSAAYGRGT